MGPSYGPVHHRLSKDFVEEDYRLVLLSRRLKDRTPMELERDYPYKKIFDVIFHLKSVSMLLPECGVLQSCVIARSPRAISFDSLRGFSMVRIDFTNLILKSCLDDGAANHSNNLLFHVSIDMSLPS
jgi:hypothetical protein